MSALKLVIANKAYSSWSLRPWILLTHFGVPFEEIVVPLHSPETRARLLSFGPTAKAPVLIDGEVTVWESLAILEYLAETMPHLPIWPREVLPRALARSLCAEMHAGFAALRQHCPTQFLRPVRGRKLTPVVAADVARAENAWRNARGLYGADGPFLFGAFSAADAMFAPVVNRLHIYDVPVAPDTRDYMDAVMALAAWKAWIAGAEAEPWRNPEYDAI
jgi:glutathione S-transferase